MNKQCHKMQINYVRVKLRINTNASDKTNEMCDDCCNKMQFADRSIRARKKKWSHKKQNRQV